MIYYQMERFVSDMGANDAHLDERRYHLMSRICVEDVSLKVNYFLSYSAILCQHYFNCFTYFILLNSHNFMVVTTIIIIPSSQMSKLLPQRISNSLKVTQLVRI